MLALFVNVDPRSSNQLQPKQSRYQDCSCIRPYPTGSSRDARRQERQGTGNPNKWNIFEAKGAPPPTRLLHDAELTGQSRLASVRLGMLTSAENQSHEPCAVPSGCSQPYGQRGSWSMPQHGGKLPALPTTPLSFFSFCFVINNNVCG
ncbi:hypothetical protein CGRA01v4_09439 [Colletotrichum graminicola]|nr:hypothetical protein CGRA01v4_09439 [Colletotrichum graminicola]